MFKYEYVLRYFAMQCHDKTEKTIPSVILDAYEITYILGAEFIGVPRNRTIFKGRRYRKSLGTAGLRHTVYYLLPVDFGLGRGNECGFRLPLRSHMPCTSV